MTAAATASPKGAHATSPSTNPVRGILLMLAAGFTFTLMDATGKHLAESLPVIEVSWGRYFFHLLVFPLFLGGQKLRSAVRSVRPGLQLVRSALLLGSTYFFFLAVKYIPLADATAIGFVSPLLVTALSVPLLGEQVGIRRWTAVIIGFAAVFIIIRPGFGMAHWAMSLPLLTASCFAFYQIATRILSRSDSAATTYFYSALVGIAVTTIFVIPEWQSPDLLGWLGLAVLGSFGGFAHYLLIRAFALAPASLLAPFSYAQMVWSIGVGYLWFDDFPDVGTLIGAAIICASGIYVIYRERRVATQTAAVAVRPSI
jgi:drug/metabolite transporter (DMT)-like permease